MYLHLRFAIPYMSQLMETFVQLKQEYLKTNHGESPNVSPKTTISKVPSPLLPAVELKSIARRQRSPSQDRLVQPSEIQRPRSALHAGDFTEDQTKEKRPAENFSHTSGYPSDTKQGGILGTSPTTPWYTPSSSFQGFSAATRFSPQERSYEDRRPWRSRAPSISSYSSSSYVLKAPTTPLVQQSNNTDLDFSPRDRSMSPDKSSRRHTLPPHSFRHVHSSPSAQLPTSTQPTRHAPSYRREGTFPYGHHPRRSLTSNWSLQASTSPQTPAYLRSRRTSFSSEMSPRQHASMVGSYEESILRGWMSTAPSKPLDFTAQIGVLGRNNCKPKCPAHVTVPFPAVFYSWSAGNGRSFTSDDPSPYVGHIDLQHLPSGSGKETLGGNEGGAEMQPQLLDDGLESGPMTSRLGSRKSKKRRRTSPSSAPPGGSYRIPEQGQLQIIIKNPNKTAVKLFLVPYDLTGMEAGFKTFVRQRSYSADTFIDSPLVAKALNDPALVARKPTLRYLIHLNICSPSKGRFYLYQHIRVVFANRVPDNKEQLRNEIQVPQPRFSAYKPNKEAVSSPSSSAAARLSADKAYRRRSSGFAFGHGEINAHATQAFAGSSTFTFDSGQLIPPIPAIPFKLISPKQVTTENVDCERAEDIMDMDSSRPDTASASDMQSPLSDKVNRFKGVQLSSSYRSNSSEGSDGYTKLSKGESGYGGMFGLPGTPEPGEGLLAMRLKSLGVQKAGRAKEDGL